LVARIWKLVDRCVSNSITKASRALDIFAVFDMN
jgi:hypothetical protein